MVDTNQTKQTIEKHLKSQHSIGSVGKDASVQFAPRPPTKTISKKDFDKRAKPKRPKVKRSEVDNIIRVGKNTIPFMALKVLKAKLEIHKEVTIMSAGRAMGQACELAALADELLSVNLNITIKSEFIDENSISAVGRLYIVVTPS